LRRFATVASAHAERQPTSSYIISFVKVALPASLCLKYR
jgi:hypothetical protein